MLSVRTLEPIVKEEIQIYRRMIRRVSGWSGGDQSRGGQGPAVIESGPDTVERAVAAAAAGVETVLLTQCGRGHEDGWARESPARAAASTTRA